MSALKTGYHHLPTEICSSNVVNINYTFKTRTVIKTDFLNNKMEAKNIYEFHFAEM